MSRESGATEDTAGTGSEACPECPATETLERVIIADQKGAGPVRTHFPGLDGRPQISDAAEELLASTLAAVKVSGIPSAELAKPGPPTMEAGPIPADPLEPPPGNRAGFEDRHNLRFEIEPWVTVAKSGEMTLNWKTWIETPPSFVHFGLHIPDQILDYPRYRRASKESGKDRRKTHKVTRSLGKFESRHFDVVGLKNTGGTIAYRIEYLDLVGGVNLFWDGVFAYVKSGSTFQRGLAISEGPHVDLPTTDGMTVWFETDLPSHGAVVVETGDAAPLVFESATLGTHHEIAVTGLEPDTLYRYRVGAIDARSIRGSRGDYAFRTAPATHRPFRFSVMSDSRSGLGGGERMLTGANTRILRDFTTESLKLGADFILFPGDLVSGYTTEVRELELQFESWKRATGPVHRYIPFFEGMGNHDYLFEKKSGGYRYDKPSPDSSEDVFAREFVNPTNGPEPEGENAPSYAENAYSFDYGAGHFVSINTNYWMSTRPSAAGNREGFVMPKQMAWLDADLAAARARGAKWLFVFTHEPGFPNGGHFKDAMYWKGKLADVNAMRTEFWSIVSKHGVTAVFHGDEHNYSRLRVDSEMDPSFENPVWQIVTGGCGAPFYGRDKTPWSKRVDVFTPQEHWVMVDVIDEKEAVMTVFGRNGETLDRVLFEPTF